MAISLSRQQLIQKLTGLGFLRTLWSAVSIHCVLPPPSPEHEEKKTMCAPEPRLNELK